MPASPSLRPTRKPPTFWNENVRALGLTSVTVVRAAVSDAAGKVSFVPEGSLGGHVGDGSGVPVDAVRLSDLITEPVDYLKVDIEGSELGVLKDLCATGKMRLVKYLQIKPQK